MQFVVLLNHNQKLYGQVPWTSWMVALLLTLIPKMGVRWQRKQLKAITGFEADRHIGMARRMVKGPTSRFDGDKWRSGLMAFEEFKC